MKSAGNFNHKSIALPNTLRYIPILCLFALIGATIPISSFAQTKNAEARMNELGPENESLSQMVGNWEVTETVWSSPTALPVTNKKYFAVRRMIGSILQEIMYDKDGSPLKDIERIDYLSFNRVEGRWKYLSMDARVPVGLMPGTSFTRGETGKITIQFDPFSLPGTGPTVSGQMLRMDETITMLNPDHSIKEQRFILADGDATPYLAHKYEYIRQK